MASIPLTSAQKSSRNLPEWVEASDAGDGRIFLRNVTRKQAKDFGATEISSDKYDNTGFAKRAVIVTSPEWIAKYKAEDKSPDDYAAVGSASNIDKPAFNKMQDQGWKPVRPDTVTLRKRLNTDTRLINSQIDAVRDAGGVSKAEARKIVMEANARGEIIDTRPGVVRGLKQKRIQFEEEQIKAERKIDIKRVSSSATNLFVSSTLSNIPRVNTYGDIGPTIKAAKKQRSSETKQSFLKSVLGTVPIVNTYQNVPTTVSPPKTKPQSFFKKRTQIFKENLVKTYKREKDKPFFSDVEVVTSEGKRFTVPWEKRLGLASLAGGPLLSVGAAGVVSQTPKAAISPVKSGIGKIANLLPKRYSTVERLITTTGSSIGLGVAAVETGRGIAKVTAPKSQKLVTKTLGFKEAQRGAAKERDIALSELPWYKEIAADIVPIYRPAESQYTKSLKEQFAGIGLDPNQIGLAVKQTKRERSGAAVGEVVGLLNIGRSSETLGRALIGKTFAKQAGKKILKKKAGREVLKRAIGPLLVAGAQEGVASEVVQSRSRQRDITAENIGKAGIFGAVSAAAIGGTIAGLSPSYGKASKVVEIASYITDPYEYPGDVLADVTEGGLVRFGIPIAPKPSLSVPPQKGKTKTLVISTDETPGFRFSKIMPQTKVSIRPSVKTKPGIQTKSDVSIKTKSKISTIPFIKTFDNAPSFIKIIPEVPPPPVPVPPNIVIPSDINTDVKIGTLPNDPIPIKPLIPPQIPEETNPETNIQTNIFPGVNLNVPVGSPLFGLPPPLPLTIPGGASRNLRKKSSKFINELDVALGFMGRPNKKQVPQKRKGKGLFGTQSLFTRLYGIAPRKKRKK